MRFETVLLSLVSSAAFAAAPKLKLAGEWDSPAGTIAIEQDKAKVVAKIVEPSPECPFEKGAEVFKGELMEDTLTGEARFCLFAPKCGTREGWSFALLLADSKGKSLSGAGEGGKDACLKGDESVVLKRAEKKKPKGPVGLPTTGYDPRAAASSNTSKARTLIEDGGNYLQEGRFEKAREQFMKAIDTDPGLPEAYNGVGVTYVARKEYDDALEWYKKSLRAAPEFGDAYYNMACVYSLQKKHELAVRYLTLAMLNSYSGWDEMEKDHDLDNVRGEKDFKELLELHCTPKKVDGDWVCP